MCNTTQYKLFQNILLQENTFNLYKAFFPYNNLLKIFFHYTSIQDLRSQTDYYEACPQDRFIDKYQPFANMCQTSFL